MKILYEQGNFNVTGTPFDPKPWIRALCPQHTSNSSKNLDTEFA